jgi:hypothetical protein
MAAWFSTGHIAYCIAALTMFEMLGLAWLRRLRGFLPTILAGDFLLLAWAQSAHWLLCAAFLLAALISHSTDLVKRCAFLKKSAQKTFAP